MTRLADAFFSVARREMAAASPAPTIAKATAMRGRLFAQQLAFLDDTDRRKSLLCPRRAGKTYAAATYLIETCLRRPGATCVFIAPTKDQAERLIWGTLKLLAHEFELALVFRETDLFVEFANGSVIRLRGCDTRADVERFRGEKYDLVIVDEAASFPSHVLAKLITDALTPTLLDHLGTLCLTGTPGAVMEGTFYQASTTAEGWSRHGWTIADNTALPHLWTEALAEKQRAGWSDENPTWIREYLGRWFNDGSELVYPYNPERNGWCPGARTAANPFGLPGEHAWRYVCGLDFGYDNRFALQVGAYAETSPNFYQVYEFSAPGLTLTPIIEAYRKAEQLAGWFVAVVGDRGSSGKGFFQTLTEEYGLPIKPAQKTEKRDHQDLVIGDLVDGKMKILRGSDLEAEMLSLVWDDPSTKKMEKPGARNDNCDAWLYLRRHAQHHYYAPPEAEPQPGSPAWAKAQEEAEIRTLLDAERRKQDPDFTPGTVTDWDDWDT